MMAGVKEVPLKIGQVRVYLLSVFLLSACPAALPPSLPTCFILSNFSTASTGPSLSLTQPRRQDISHR